MLEANFLAQDKCCEKEVRSDIDVKDSVGFVPS
jgi:hypothetical protein